MDRAMQLRHLEQAEQHIAEGARHIAEQEARVAKLDQRGHDTTEAIKLLHALHATQKQHVEHRNRILRELEQ